MSQLGSDDLIELQDYTEPLSLGSSDDTKARSLWPTAEPRASSGSSSSTSSKGKAPEIITKDAEYFIESTFMIFQVENCLFRVPTYLFAKESHVFSGMFHLPQPHTSDSGDTEGSSESNPIILPDEFTKTDFRCLLKALYPLSFTLHLTLSKEEWLSVLKLSTKWYFLSLRSTAISELERMPESHSLTSLEKITYGRNYNISSWLLSGLVDLVIRDASINDDDALDIDSDYPTTAYKLFRTRELRLRGFLASRAAGVKEIEGLFKEELHWVRADERGFYVLEEYSFFDHEPPVDLVEREKLEEEAKRVAEEKAKRAEEMKARRAKEEAARRAKEEAAMRKRAVREEELIWEAKAEKTKQEKAAMEKELSIRAKSAEEAQPAGLFKASVFGDPGKMKSDEAPNSGGRGSIFGVSPSSGKPKKNLR